MDDIKNLGDKVAFLEQMNVTYGDLLYKEERYLQTLNREKTRNVKGFRTFVIFDIVMALIAAGGLSAGSLFRVQTNDPAAAQVGLLGAAMVGVVGIVLAAFALVGLGFGTWKLIHYAKRRFREIDNRDFVWRSYEDMEAISGAKMMELEKKKAENLAELTVKRQMYQQALEDNVLRIGNGEEEEEPEHISMSELFYVKETAPLPLAEKEKKDALKRTW